MSQRAILIVAILVLAAAIGAFEAYLAWHQLAVGRISPFESTRP